MSPVDDIDVPAYATAPSLDVAGQIALGRQLVAAAPADLSAHAELCRKDLLAKTHALEVGYQQVQGESPSPDKRIVDRFGDGSWAATKGRLEAYEGLDEERLPVVGRAKVLAKRLFPSGLTFTLLEYGAQWAEANWRIKVITEEGLEPELRELCGDLFVDELLRWHKEYGKMVGVIASRRGSEDKTRPRPNLAELRRQAMHAVVAWQIQLVALHLAGHPGARAGLRPTDQYRDKLAAASGPRPAPEPSPPSSPAPVSASQPGAMPS